MRNMNQTRAAQIEYFRANAGRVVTFKKCSLVVAYYVHATGTVYAKGWRGKGDKAAWYHSFRSLASLESFVRAFADRLEISEGARAKRKEEAAAARATLKASDYWTVGDVVYNSWGYDQTNVDFYQVVEVKAKSIVIREIKQNNSDHGGPSGGRTAPRRGEFCGEPMLKPLDERGNMSFRFGGASKWTGRAVGCSSYH